MTTTTASPGSAASSTAEAVSRAARLAAPILAVLGAELVLAAAIVQGRVAYAALLLAAVLGLTLVFQQPALVALGIAVLTDSLFRPTFVELPAGPTNLRLHELALGGLLLASVLRPKARSWGGTAGGWLAAFLVVLVVSAATAVAAGRVSASNAIAWSRPFFMLTIFWVVVRVFPDAPTRRRLLLGGAVLAAASAVVALALALGSGLGHRLLTPADQATAAAHAVGSIKRIRLPGLSLGYALFWYVAVQVYLARGIRRTGWSLLLAGDLLAIAISFNRNMWLGLVVGCVLMAMVGGFALRARLVHTLVVAVAGLLVIAVLGAGSSQTGPAAALIKRGQTIFQPSEVSRESSLRDREHETSLAWKAFVAHPLLGVGPGAPFGLATETHTGPHSTAFDQQRFLHNQYLYLLLIGGVPALVAFLVFLVSSVRRAWSRVPPDPLIAACGVGLAMIMVSAIVAIYFSVEDMTLPLGLLAGIIAADQPAVGQSRPGAPIR
jgi:O-antigen ligase